MSISIRENSSLLATLPTLEQKPASQPVTTEHGFADQLDQAVTGKPRATVSSNDAKYLAESLSLQMLQTSLSLAGDVASEPQEAHRPLNSAASLLQAYKDNLKEPEAHTTASTEKHLSALQQSSSTATIPVSGTRAANSFGDASWLDPIIDKASRRYGVETGLIRAVIKAESNFNPAAVSHAGAQGLMQLMPGTARSLGVNDSFDPEQNVMAGTRFLSELINRYDGNLDSALAAYNWGPGNVDRHSDRLPRETRDYLARVKQLFSTYSG